MSLKIKIKVRGLNIDRLHGMYTDARAEASELDRPLKFDVKFAKGRIKQIKRLISRHAKVSF